MTDPASPPAPRWLAWMPAASVGAIIAGALLASGGYISQLAEHDRRIAALERVVEQQGEIDRRTTRIEAKLDVLVPHDTEARR